MNKKILFIAILVVCALKMNAQMIVIKSDILQDAATMPNVHLDFVVGEKHSIGFGGGYCHKMWGNDISIATFTPNFRYWFNGRPFTRQFIGISTQFSKYNIAWDKKVYDGKSLAVGVLLGHVFNLSKRWNIELEGGINTALFARKEYYKGDSYDDFGDIYNNRGITAFPHLSLSVSYIIK